MYSLVSAIAKPVTGGGRWLNVEIGALTFRELFATYSRIIATLSNPFDDTNTALDLAKIEWSVDPSLTFNAFLTANGANTLPTSTTLPQISTKYAKYKDVFQAGYSVTPISPNAAVDSQLPDEDKTWLFLTQPKINWTLFKKSVMVSVNGYFHFMDADSNGAYIRDGMQSRTISRQNQIGMVSFAGMAGLEYVDLTADMIYKQNPDLSMAEGLYIKVGQDISSKTVMLVIGGYLHVLDEQTFKRVGDDIIKVDIANFPLLDRYYESIQYLDLSSLNLEHNDRNPEEITIAQLYSDAALKAYFSLSQSFIVLADNPEIFRETQDIQRLSAHGEYISTIEPVYPLITGKGRVSEYWPTYDRGRWLLSIRDPRRYRPTYYTTTAKAQVNVDARNESVRPWLLSHAAFLMIGSDVAAGI